MQVMNRYTSNNHDGLYKWFADNTSAMKTYLISIADEGNEVFRKLNETERKVNTKQRSDIDLIRYLSDDILYCLVFEYLSPAEVCRFSLTNKYYYQLISSSKSIIGNIYWNHHQLKLADKQLNISTPLPIESKAKLVYLENMLKLTNYEIEHWTSCANADSALQKFSRKICKDHHKPISERTIIGMVSNIGRMPSREIAKAIGARRKYAMYSCLVQSMDSAVQFRKSSCNIHQGLSFIPITGPTSANDSMTLEMNIAERNLYQSYIEILPGFIGRAVDLVELEPEYEFLRYGVLKSMVYRNITVWKNRKSFEEAAIELARRKMEMISDVNQMDALVIDVNLFRNPVFVEEINTPVNHDEEEDVKELNPCLVASPALIHSSLLERPDIRMPGYDPHSHLEKLKKLKQNLLTSIAWIHYQ